MSGKSENESIDIKNLKIDSIQSLDSIDSKISIEYQSNVKKNTDKEKGSSILSSITKILKHKSPTITPINISIDELEHSNGKLSLQESFSYSDEIIKTFDTTPTNSQHLNNFQVKSKKRSNPLSESSESNDSVANCDLHIDYETYIPYKIARDFISTMNQDMNKIKNGMGIVVHQNDSLTNEIFIKKLRIFLQDVQNQYNSKLSNIRKRCQKLKKQLYQINKRNNTTITSPSDSEPHQTTNSDTKQLLQLRGQLNSSIQESILWTKKYNNVIEDNSILEQKITFLQDRINILVQLIKSCDKKSYSTTLKKKIDEIELNIKNFKKKLKNRESNTSNLEKDKEDWINIESKINQLNNQVVFLNSLITGEINESNVDNLFIKKSDVGLVEIEKINVPVADPLLLQKIEKLEFDIQKLTDTNDNLIYQIRDMELNGVDTLDMVTQKSPPQTSEQIPNIPTKENKHILDELNATKRELLIIKKENNQLNNKKGDSKKDAIQDKEIKNLKKKTEYDSIKMKKYESAIKQLTDKMKNYENDIKSKNKQIDTLNFELVHIGESAQQTQELNEKIHILQKDNKKLNVETIELNNNFKNEMTLRKKYHNIIEDLKGKIRVYCRVRPLSYSEKNRNNTNIVNSIDEYTMKIKGPHGEKEFQFDKIFMPASAQRDIFDDTSNLIQSAIDGFNVCIFAYGQTGSGKTYTIIGAPDNPGIAPRSFERIFEIIEQNKATMTATVQVYMLELYNDQLIDLFAKTRVVSHFFENFRIRWDLDIKKNAKGMVFIQGSVVKSAYNSKELYALFNEGSKSRHIASTKMNSESSRSHLIIGILMESIVKSTGKIISGKLSLVDLAGSERASKTEANTEQLKEAMSINKSLSALGDVIAALSSQQDFIPYRNNKLTMLMQDSLGGNAKTLMFVNISPVDYNQEESIVSLTYASRVKLITNDVTKNAESKEVNKLKQIISKLKKGENVEIENVL
ncbi:hypothetical protein A3Q56_01610 [Intoshia linei]|uniref:Kinesin-like protein n=1 Tax=Intoshia linei TaxID=1819745 RepID=A0A177BB20_9BILA|nr:hypothetical protein A3Q56_01610 [Intoshia linei]